MACNGKAKVKILYLLKTLQEETDAAHGLTMAQIIERLAEYGVSAERKSIYDDIKARDKADSQPNAAPLRAEEEAHNIDSSALSVEEHFRHSWRRT